MQFRVRARMDKRETQDNKYSLVIVWLSLVAIVFSLTDSIVDSSGNTIMGKSGVLIIAFASWFIIGIFVGKWMKERETNQGVCKSE